MTQLKSGVYFVRYQDITKFFQDAEKNGWKFGLDEPQKRIYATLRNHGREDKTIKQFVIPFSLDKRKRRIGYWSQHVCFESDVEITEFLNETTTARYRETSVKVSNFINSAQAKMSEENYELISSDTNSMRKNGRSISVTLIFQKQEEQTAD